MAPHAGRAAKSGVFLFTARELFWRAGGAESPQRRVSVWPTMRGAVMSSDGMGRGKGKRRADEMSGEGGKEGERDVGIGRERGAGVILRAPHSAMDVLACAMMKGAANCRTHCDLQNAVTIRSDEGCQAWD